MSEPVFSALNKAIDTVVLDVSYQTTCAAVFFPTERPPGGPCALYFAHRAVDVANGNQVQPLGVSDLAGLFAVQAIAAAIAVLIVLGQRGMRYALARYQERQAQGLSKKSDSEAAAEAA